MTSLFKNTFALSFSVGTACQAKCPYCGIPKISSKIASGNELIASTKQFISELQPWFDSYSVRITGGEVGLVPNIGDYISWLNCQDNIYMVKIYTNGLLFKHKCQLFKKCYVIDHSIQNIINGELVSYKPELNIIHHNELINMINERNSICYKYRMIFIDYNNDTSEILYDGFHKLNIRIKRPMRTLTNQKNSKNTFCYKSKYLYVYDVAHNKFFNCCMVKDPIFGVTQPSIINFICEIESKRLYPACNHCDSFEDIYIHPNASSIELLRTTRDKYCA